MSATPRGLRDREVPPRPDAPAMATGLAAFALGNGAGEISLPRETRGAVLDWGGFYGQDVRLTGPWSVADRWGPEGAVVALRTESVVQSHGSFRVARSGPELIVEEELAAHVREPSAVWRRRFRSPAGRGGPLAVGVEFTPMLAPVLMEGIRPTHFRFESEGTSLRISSGAFSLGYDADPLPAQVRLDGRPWLGGRYEGPLRRVALVHPLTLPEGGEAALRIVVSGGRRGRHPSGPVTPFVDRWAALHRAEVSAWFDATPELEIPEAPELVAGYDLAVAAIRALYTSAETGFQGLVAGYPWYAALWCRDLAQMLPAVLWLGDAPWAATSLDTVFGFQAPERLDALGASPGELPMQVSPGPVFLYGTSDTSLYYPGLVRRYVDHTGDEAGARRWFRALDGVLGWARAKVVPGTGLFRNGNELLGLRAAGQGQRVRIGVDAFDTTIWDSSDRRDHAVELQRYYLDLLRDLAALGELPDAPSGWRALGDEASRFAGTLPGRYRWPEEGYLLDTLRGDGSPGRQLRPNALRWVGGGLLDPAGERALIDRATRDDLATPWGLRTLSAADPGYDPRAYHMGQVWPIASAWLAEAQFAAGRGVDGAATLRRLAGQIVAENGWSNECYRGDRPEPFDSCFVLGFSVAPFVTSIFGGLLGLVADARHRTLRIRPPSPAPFAAMRVRGLRFGPGTIDLAYDAAGVDARWSGPGPVVLAGPSASLRLDPGASGRLPLPGAALSS